MYWEAFYALSVLLSAVATLVLVLWMLFDVLWRQRPRKPARFEPDRAQLRKLQAKRRLALRQLGERWVLHKSQPRVSWGFRRG